MKTTFIYASIFTFLSIFIGSFWWTPILWILLLAIPLFVIGLLDIVQPRQALRRNFPLVGRFRYLLEDLRPKIQQYFIESDTDGRPFSRIHRNVVYQRAKQELDTTPFGTQLNVYENNYEWLNHSINALPFNTITEPPRVIVGGPNCKQPYSASVFNISAMSYGSLSKNAIMALNQGAKLGNFAHNTGEGAISKYHLEGGGDIIWQIGTGYFGCRYPDGNFNPDAFQERANMEQVKMIEIKLSQGAKPGHGGMLPGAKVTDEIAYIRLVEKGKDVDSPPYHSAFSTPIELLNFIKLLRSLSKGKPIGFKLCIGHRSEFIAICKAMNETGIYPDFVTVDGGEGGTGAAPLEFSNHVGMPLRDALAFVYDALTGFDLKKHIKIMASGKIATGFDLVKCFALGADLCYSARGMMMALGCIQALECNTNKCPVGVATQNPTLVRGLVVEDKRVRVANFHKQTIKSACELMAAAGIKHPNDIHRAYIHRRISPDKILTYLDTYPYIPKGSLLKTPYAKQFELLMTISDPYSFTPNFEKLNWEELEWARKPMTD
ncbi:FMN-binding glutamate synthase family protein [Olivibacter sp. SDN3]|uniref:FMN-binding glutamate synthase family protein n=1 Tax=Olivibacter sp. SDN3 TaxID=2764720 RepID=UPI0016511A24|nr:FMN-binding glutamate synthase family protein [Olivibacter sp. SDN3]QNL48439.1 FMN-binding glutamate synthase family protein [Olivibacter sp. SDN3]